MKLKSFSFLLGLLIILITTSSITEEKIDIWNNKKEPVKNIQNQKKQDSNESLNTNSSQTVQTIGN